MISQVISSKLLKSIVLCDVNTMDLNSIILLLVTYKIPY